MMLKTLPVVEMFGPVVEGEGYFAGVPTTFIRLGYCDSRCYWCDSMHAVDPVRVREVALQLTPGQIEGRVLELHQGYPLITLSGGNPLVHDLTDLVDRLEAHDLQVKVETQGTIYRPWINNASHVVCSPKPPSARPRAHEYHRFTEFWKALKVPKSLKLVVFDAVDLAWAYQVVGNLTPKVRDLYLSCGTAPTDTRDDLGERYAWLCTAALQVFARAPVKIHILPQLHVLAYLHRQGV